jgi:hypothetical protein
MDSRLLAGAICCVAAALVLVACLLAARNPRQSLLANDFLVGSVILPLALGMLSIGGMLVAEALLFRFSSLSPRSLATALGVFAAGSAVYLLIGVKKRLKAYEQAEHRPTTGIQGSTHGSGAHNMQPPSQGMTA